MKGTMAEFTVRQVRNGDNWRTELVIHDTNVIAVSKETPINPMGIDGIYDKIFDYAKSRISK